MKNKLFFSFFLCVFFSCNDYTGIPHSVEEEDQFDSNLLLGDSVKPDSTSKMLGGIILKNAFITALEDISDELTVIWPTWDSSAKEFEMEREAEKEVVRYEEMMFRVVATHYHDAFGIVSGSKEWAEYLWFQDNKCKQINDYIEARYLSGLVWHSPRYTYAGVREGAQIYANVPLFGRKAREPLNDKFAVTSYSPLTWIRVSYPDFNIISNGYEEDLPTDFDEVFQAGTALFSYISDGFVFSFKEIPEERYKAITFSIEIPIEGEYFQLLFNGEDYPESYYTYEKRVLPNENRVLRGSVTVRFEE